MAMGDQIEWTKDGEETLIRLKQALSLLPCLGLPDHSKPFYLFVVFMSAVLTQTVGGKMRPVGFYWKRLHTVARALLPCRHCSYVALTCSCASFCLLPYLTGKDRTSHPRKTVTLAEYVINNVSF
uniref:Reverse transcriptase/retrotransposon-derived protein RNase H-like domain-containing protein n=1 Tax=Hucho hucho TaxID=62062 RepID=A0A4W5JKC0_9TELE